MNRSQLIHRQSWLIEQLPGLSNQDCQKLKDCGIDTTEQLLQKVRPQLGKEKLAVRMQIHAKHLNKWVAMAELASIPAVGCQYCGLLVQAGIGSIPQLAQTSIEQLHRQILRFYVANLQRRDLCPDIAVMLPWIEQAKSLSKAKF
jgi:hypothetical protein